MICRLIVDKSLARKLSAFDCNLQPTTTPTDAPHPVQCHSLRILYSELRSKFRDIRPNFKFCVNGVLLDLASPRLDGLQFIDYRFGYPLVDCMHFNYTKNGLPLKSRFTAHEIDCEFLNSWIPEMRPYPDLGRSREQGFSVVLFIQLFPNLHVVELSGPDTEITFQKFLFFLKRCQGLTTLKMINTGYPACFYPLLATLDSTRFLTELVLLDQDKYHDITPINFGFLTKLLYLKHMKTNLATRDRMTSCIKSMRIKSTFTFFFAATRDERNLNRCEFRRDDEDLWFVHIIQNHPKSQTHLLNIKGTSNWNDMAKNLSLQTMEQIMMVITRHWMDALG